MDLIVRRMARAANEEEGDLADFIWSLIDQMHKLHGTNEMPTAFRVDGPFLDEKEGYWYGVHEFDIGRGETRKIRQAIPTELASVPDCDAGVKEWVHIIRKVHNARIWYRGWAMIDYTTIL